MRLLRHVPWLLLFSACTHSAEVADTRTLRSAPSPLPSYPPTPQAATVGTYYGITVPEPFRWLEELSSADTRAWVASQNVFAEEHLARLPGREEIRRLLGTLSAPPAPGVPFQAGTQYFVLRRGGGQTQPVLYIQSDLDASARVLLDINPLAEDSSITLVDEFLHPSPDGRLLAYGIARSGSDWQELRIRDVHSGADLPDRIEGMRTWMWVSWTADGKGFFYPRQPPPAVASAAGFSGADQLLYHRVGTPQLEDPVIWNGSDQPRLAVRPRVTEDGRYVILFMSAGNSSGNRLHLIDLGDPTHPNLSAPILPLVDSADASYTVIGNRGPEFYIATTLDAPKGRVIRIDARDPRRAQWQTIIPEGEGTISASFFSNQARIVGDRLIVPVREGVERKVRFYTLDGQSAGELPLPGVGNVGAIRASLERPELYYAFSRFPHPTSVYRYNLGTGETALIETPRVAFDPDKYETAVQFFVSRDGTRVPMFITHRKGIARDGSHPTLLFGYGGYGGIVGPAGYASDHRLLNTAWLEMGGIVAVAALRGGGEYGAEWHRAGMRERKQNTFDDFIAAAEYLIREGHTSPTRLAISGNSNGGLTVAATITQRPDLFAAALPDVGLTDMLRNHQLRGGQAGANEFGTPETPEGFGYLHAYSPLHNLKPGTCYPATLVTAGMNDEIVHPSHSFKFAAALQAAQACARPVLLWTEMDAGHGGGASAEARQRKTAGVLAFLSQHLNSVR